MASGATGRQRMLVSAGVHPHWRAVARTFAVGTGHEIVEVPLKDASPTGERGRRGAAVVGLPNYLGVMEDMGAQEAGVATRRSSCWRATRGAGC